MHELNEKFIGIIMTNSAAKSASTIQKEMEELKARLNQSRQTIIQGSMNKSESTELLSLMIKSTATFEKN
ncbi:hypothetical protein A1Q5_18015 [Aliivibrio logei 5S-186]|uniref:Uncharacterized protein n=2 Tax=Vibrionaceae TaxID=641 RepID=A0ABX3AXR2_ALILO|nr:hypothetical protein A1Q5_18015 [Aliivibrio logei 5S-186]